MQNFIITLVLFLFSLFVSAQEVPEKFTLEKGTVALGGSIGINSNRSENESFDSKNFGFSLRPEAAYFISDNLSLGMLLGYTYNSNKYKRSDSMQETTYNSFTIAPYLQKYIGISESFAFNLTGSLDYTRNWYEDNNTNCLNCSDTTRDVYGIAIRPGISYLLSDKLSLDANLGVLRFTHTDIDEQTIDASANSLILSFGLSNIYFGLTYYLN